MLNRRTLMMSAGAAAALTGCATAGPARTPQAPDEAARLNRLFDEMFAESLDASPERVTSLGLDTGARAGARSRLSDRSLAGLARDKARTADQLARLRAIDARKLSGMAAVNHASVLFSTELTDAANRRFAYGEEGAGQPYVLSQLTGAYQDIPDFLGTRHRVETAADAEAYLARLEAFSGVLDAEIARVRRDAGLGVIPPDFVLDRTLGQLQGLIGPAETSPLVTSLADRAAAKGLTGDWRGRAAAIYAREVTPALQRQAALVRELRARASHDAGVWRLPDGEAYYAHALQRATTTRLTPDEVHEMGLDQARSLSARADAILKTRGLTQGSVGARIRALFDDPAHRYPNTDAGRQAILADLNRLTQAMAVRLPTYFGTQPKAPVEIRRVPAFIEAGAPGGYYNTPTLDGSRPGIFWINLRDTAENPRWTLPTLVYHEALPGHHMQLALQQEADLPMLRRASINSAYAEGWALYAEQMAQEMGVYADDPLGEVGYLQAALFRSARLVVDTGLHAKRWSREQAIRTMTEIDGSLESAATTEIERYCVWPGQACSYMVGKLTFLRLRDRARQALGPRFDIRGFHDAALLAGAVPLTVLEQVVDNHVAARGA